MKIYNRVQFILALVCGLFAIHAVKTWGGTNNSLIWGGFFGYMMIKSLIKSFSKPKENDDNEKAD